MTFHLSGYGTKNIIVENDRESGGQGNEQEYFKNRQTVRKSRR